MWGNGARDNVATYLGRGVRVPREPNKRETETLAHLHPSGVTLDDVVPYMMVSGVAAVHVR